MGYATLPGVFVLPQTDETNGVASTCKNGWLEDEFPFRMAYFQELCQFQGGYMQGAPTLPGFGVATSALGDFFTYLTKKHVKKQQQKCVLCFAFLFGTVKTTLFPQILGKTCLFFPHFPKKRDLENPPQKMTLLGIQCQIYDSSS